MDYKKYRELREKGLTHAQIVKMDSGSSQKSPGGSSGGGSDTGSAPQLDYDTYRSLRDQGYSHDDAVSIPSRFKKFTKEDAKYIGLGKSLSSFDKQMGMSGSSKFRSKKDIYGNSMQAVDLLKQVIEARKYYTTSKDEYDEEYVKGVLDSLDSADKYLRNAVGNLKNQSAYWGQWDTEDDYKRSYARNRRLSNIDLPTAKAEMDELRKQLKYDPENPSTMYGLTPDEIQSSKDLRSKIEQKEVEHAEAEKLQKGIRYSSYLEAPDFKEYAEKGAGADNNVLNAKIDVGKLAGGAVKKFLMGPLSDPMDNASPAAMFMNDDERKIYLYLLGKDNEKGTNEADNYISYLSDTLNQREGVAKADSIKGITPLEALYTIPSGIEHGLKGVSRYFSDDDIPYSSTEYANQRAQENLNEEGPVQGFIGEIFSNIGNMAPSLAVGAVNPIAGAATMGVSSGGNYYKEALDAGYPKGQAQTYATLSGASEGFFQYLLGGISKLGGKLSDGAINRVVQNINNSYLRIGTELGIKAFGEGSEEYLQDIINPALRNLIFKENNEINPLPWDNPEAVHSFLLGAITAGLLEGPSTVSGTLTTKQSGRAVMQAEKYDELIQNALALDPKTKAYKDAKRMQVGKTKANASNVGELVKQYRADGGSLAFMSVPNEAYTADAEAARARTDEQSPVFTRENASQPVGKLTYKTRTINEDGYNNLMIEAFDGDDPVGTMSVMVSDEGAYLERIDVDENKRNLGYGTEMIRYASGLSDVLYTAPDNEDSKRLFERLGTPTNEYGVVDQGYGVYVLDNMPQEAVGRAVSEEVPPTIDTMPTQVTDEITPEFQAAQEVKRGPGGGLVAMRKKDRSTAEVKGIFNVKNGNVMVKTADNRAVPLNDIQIEDEAYNEVYRAAAVFDTETARAFVEHYHGDIPANDYFLGFMTIYGAGRKGMSLPQARALDESAPLLSDVAGTVALYAGKKSVQGEADKPDVPDEDAGIAAEEAEEAQKTVEVQPEAAPPAKTEKEEPAPAAEQKKGGVVRAYKGKTTAAQDAQINAVDAVFKAVGRTVVIEDTIDEIKGHQIANGPNAYFDPTTNEYHIALDSAGQAYMFYAAHESVHDIAANNPLGYDVLEETVFDILRAKGDDIDARIEVQRGLHKDKDESYWKQEVVANTVPVILTSERFGQEIAERFAAEDEETRSVFKKLLDSIRAFLQKAYDILKTQKSWKQMESIKGDIDAIDKIINAYFPALEDAVKAETVGGQEPLFSIRETKNGNKYVEWDREVIKGADPAKWGQQVEDYINSEIRKGKDVVLLGENDTPLTISAYTAGKAPARIKMHLKDGSWRAATDAEHRLKLRAETHIDELAKVSTGKGNVKKPDFKGGHLFARDGFTYRTAYFKDKTGYYQIQFSVGKDGKVNTVYNIGIIKPIKRTAPPTNGLKGPTRSKTETGDAVLGDKNVTQTDTSVKDEKPRYSLKDPVESTDTLIAVHNLNGEKLRNALELGGFPMPSIAITKPQLGHEGFGDISLIFGRDTINPANRKNKVYSSDAWTPTFPTVEYKLNSQKASAIYKRFLKEWKDTDYSRTLRLPAIDPDNLTDYANRSGGDIASYFEHNEVMQMEYLKEKGVDFKVPTRERKYDSILRNDGLRRVIARYGVDRLTDIKNGSWDDITPELIANLQDIANDDFLNSLDQPEKQYYENREKDLYNEENFGKVQADNIIRNALVLNKAGENVYETDSTATRDMLEKLVDKDGYKAWLDNLFSDIIEKRGIRNNADFFTPIGNRRSFEALHWDVTMDNLVKAMKSQEEQGGGGFFGKGPGSLAGASARKLTSIRDIKNEAKRISAMPDEEIKALRDSYGNRLSDIAHRLTDSDDLRTVLDGADAIVEAVQKSGTTPGIAKYLSEWPRFNVSDDLVNEIYDLMTDMRNAPTKMFEAKPHRAVPLEEVRAAIMPEGRYPDIEKELTNRDIPVETYDENKEGDRLRALNSDFTKEIRFSLKDTSDVDVQRLEKENARLTEALELVKAQFKLTEGHHVKDADLKRLARSILREYASEYDSDVLVENLRTMFDYLGNAEQPAWDVVAQMGVGMAKSILNKSSMIDKSAYEYYTDARNYLRSSRISLTKNQHAEVAYAFDSYRDYRNRMFGNVNLANDGLPLDVAWQELSDIAPELFDPDTVEGDMPMALMEAVEVMRPKYVNPYEYNTNEAAYDLFLRVYDRYFDIPEVRTFADKKAAKLDRVKSQYRNKIAEIRKASRERYNDRLKAIRAENAAKRRELSQRYNEAKAKHHTEDMAHFKARYKRLTEKKNEQLMKQRAAFKEWKATDRARRAEQAAKTKYRARIEKTVKELYDWMLRPTDAKHVPEHMRKLVADFLETVDVAGKKNTMKAQLWRTRLRDLKDAMARIERGQADVDYRGFYAEVDPDFIPRLEAFIDLNRGVSTVEEMNADQLRELDFLVGIMKRSVVEANKLHANARFDDVAKLGEYTIGDLAARKAAKLSGRMLQLAKNLLNIGQLDSFSYFDELGGAAWSILDSLRNGFDKKIRLINEAVEHMKGVLKGADTKKWSGVGVEAKVFKVEGGELRLTTAQIMELYLLNQRAQARGHIYGGGIKPIDQVVKVGKKTVRQRTHAPVKVRAQDVQNIISTLTNKQKAVADTMQKFISERASEWGNEAAMTLYGYRKFTEENYWPIKTDEDFVNTQDPQAVSGLYALRNLGMTKATVEGASNPIVLGDAFDTFTRHVDEMATYSGLVAPLSDAMKWFNYREADLGSVKQSIGRVLGDQGKHYFINLIKDINGMPAKPYTTGISDTLTRNAKLAAVGFNLSVAIQQPFSYIRAAAEISPASLMRAVFKKPNIALAQKYAPIARWKSWGFYDLNISRSVREIIVGDATAPQKVREASLWAAQQMDNLTWGTLWNAVEIEIQRTQPYLKPGTEEYNEAVGARLSEIIDRTQVVDTVFHRSQLMRSESGLVKLYTAFMSEPTKSYNLLRNSVRSVARKESGAGKALARVALVFVTTQVANAAARAFIDAFRRAGDDEDKDEKEDSWGERWLRSFGSEAARNVNPLDLIPGAREILSMLEGYDASRMDLKAVETLIGSVNAWMKFASGESKWSAYKLIQQSATALSGLTGIPAGNLIREFNSLYNAVAEENIDMESEMASAEKSYTTIYKAILAGDTAKVKSIRELLAKDKDAPKSPADIDTGVAGVLMKNDARVAEAYEARAGVNTSRLRSIINDIVSDGFGMEVVKKAINLYENTLSEKSGKDLTKELSAPLYDNNDLFEAIRYGSASDVEDIYNELLATSEAEDPAGTIKRAVSAEFKKEYLRRIDMGDTYLAEALADKLKFFGYTDDDVKDWSLDDKSAKMREAIRSGDIYAANAHIQELQELGREPSSIKSSLTSTYKDEVIRLYDLGDYDGIQEIIDTLSGLDLRARNGSPYYTYNYVWSWVHAHYHIPGTGAIK